MNTKQEAFALLREEFERWDSLVNRLSESQLTSPEFPDGWSIKDMVAHLHDWQERSIARAEAVLNDREPAYPDWPTEFDPEIVDQPHDLNAWLYAQTRDQPWADVYRNWRDGFQSLLELSDQIPENTMLDAQKYPWLDGYAFMEVLEGTYEHHKEHWEFLEPVLAKTQNSGA